MTHQLRAASCGCYAADGPNGEPVLIACSRHACTTIRQVQEALLDAANDVNRPPARDGEELRALATSLDGMVLVPRELMKDANETK
jgi:hypothetical protein